MSRTKAVTHSHGARRDKCIDLASFAEKFAKLERKIDDSYNEGYAAGVKAGKRLANPNLPKLVAVKKYSMTSWLCNSSVLRTHS
jgi:hypothetical protein